MKTVQMEKQRLVELIARFSKCRIAVLGDFFLDKYLDVDPALVEPSVETGKPAHQVVSVRCSPGAAGSVASNLAALGTGQLHAIGFTGDDGEGYDLRKGLRQLGCHTEHLHSVTSRRTPTYLKPRDTGVESLSAEHSRYDTKNHTPTPVEIEEMVIRSLDTLLADVDAVVVLDQVEQRDCGVVTDTVRKALSQRAGRTKDVFFWADSRRWIREFPNLIIKPNQFEAVGMDNPVPGDKVSPDALRQAAGQLRNRNGAPVLITRGEQGMIVSDPEWTLVPGVKVTGETDPTGAGDSATAGTVLALCAGAELPEAALVGNLVASITIEQIATTGVARPDQLPQRFEMWLQQQEKMHMAREEEA